MPQVAFEPNIVLKPILTARQAPARSSASSFDSMLDETDAAPPRPAPDDSASRTDQTQSSAKDTDSKAANSGDKASADANAADATSTDTKADGTKPSDAKAAKSTDGKSSKIKDSKVATAGISDGATTEKTDKADKANKTDKSDKPDGDAKVTADATAAANVKTADQAVATVDGKPVSEGNPTNGPVASALGTAPAASPIQTVTTGDAVATVVAPAPTAAAQPGTAVSTAALTSAVTAATTGALAKAKPEAETTKSSKADAGKDTDDSKAPAKTGILPQTDDKPQVAATDGDKADAHARGEAQVKTHAAAGGETPATVTADANTATSKAGADAATTATLTAQPQTTAPAASTTTAAATASQLAPQAAAIPLAGVAIEITNKALSGTNHFQIRLDPPELGRIEVRLDVDRDGNVTSRMVADRSDTLDLLRRDSAGLERALQDAGLKTSDNGLQFSLRDQSTNQQQGNGSSSTARLVVEDQTMTATAATTREYGRLAGQGSGIDIHV